MSPTHCGLGLSRQEREAEFAKSASGFICGSGMYPLLCQLCFTTLYSCFSKNSHLGEGSPHVLRHLVVATVGTIPRPCVPCIDLVFEKHKTQKSEFGICYYPNFFFSDFKSNDRLLMGAWEYKIICKISNYPQMVINR